MLAIALALIAVAPQGPAATPTPLANPKARVCRKIKAPTGSRLGAKQECRTAAAWAALDAAGQDDVDAMRRRTSRQTW